MEAYRSSDGQYELLEPGRETALIEDEQRVLMAVAAGGLVLATSQCETSGFPSTARPLSRG